MSWNLEGMRVKGLYVGDVPVEGTVINSRVACGGWSKHIVKLDAPTIILGSVREEVVIKDCNITKIFKETVPA